MAALARRRAARDGECAGAWNRPYLNDILDWAASGAVRDFHLLHFNNFIAAIALYAPYLAAIAVAGWMWVFGRASFLPSASR
jgi:hypothetical protein